MRSIKHTFVKIFGGMYVDGENCECYAGIIPFWFRCRKAEIGRWLLLRKYDIRIWYLKFKVRKY